MRAIPTVRCRPAHPNSVAASLRRLAGSLPAMAAALAISTISARAVDPRRAAEFESDIRPSLAYYCNECHKTGKEVPFLAARTLPEINQQRSHWRSVSAQLRNRTMPPPGEDQPEEAERLSRANPARNRAGVAGVCRRHHRTTPQPARIRSRDAASDGNHATFFRRQHGSVAGIGVNC